MGTKLKETGIFVSKLANLYNIYISWDKRLRLIYDKFNLEALHNHTPYLSVLTPPPY